MRLWWRKKKTYPFEPDWLDDYRAQRVAAPKGDDEPQVAALYAEMKRELKTPWEELDEWIKEAWRREYRDL